MAITLQALRSLSITNLWGRRLGLDPNSFLVGPKSLRMQTVALTSANSTATTVDNWGVTGIGLTTLATTTNSSAGSTETGSVFALGQPTDGVRKYLYASTIQSTNATAFDTAPARVVWTTAGSTFTFIKFTGPGQYVSLVGVSTLQWVVMSHSTGTSFTSSD